MAEQWIEIQPGGYLKKYGSHRFFVNTPAEAIRAMMIQIKGFEQAFKASEAKGIKFAITADKRNITDLEQLHMGQPKVVKLIPKYKGSKNQGMTFLAIAVVIAATVMTAGTAGFGAGGWFAAGSTSAAIATSVAVSMALGGISMLLAPKQPGLETRTDTENEASYAFGGPVNTIQQGAPVPAFWGEREVGGAVISASMTSEDQR